MASLIRFKIKSRVSWTLLFKNKRHSNLQFPVHVFWIASLSSPNFWFPELYLLDAAVCLCNELLSPICLLSPNHTNIDNFKLLIRKHSKTSLVKIPLIWVLDNQGSSSMISPPGRVSYHAVKLSHAVFILWPTSVAYTNNSF